MKKNIVRRAFSRNETYLFIALVILVTAVSLVNPRFLTGRNLFQILRSYSFIGVLSVGFLFVLISGGIDISFTATATAAQYFTAVAMVNNPDIPIIVVIVMPMLIGTALGSINGLLIHYLNAPSIIIAIANLNAYYGIVQLISAGQWLYQFPPWFAQLPKTLLIRFVDENGGRYGLSILTAIWIGMLILGAIILGYTKLGRRIYAMGGNLEGARRAGLSIVGLRLFAFSFLGFAAGVAGLVHALSTQTVAPNALFGREFDVVAAVVLGGASLFGGAGTILGTFLGVALIAVITNALTIMEVPSYWHQVFIGGVVLLSVSVTAIRTQLARKKERTIDVA